MENYIEKFKSYLKKSGKTERTVLLYANWVDSVLNNTGLNPYSLISPEIAKFYVKWIDQQSEIDKSRTKTAFRNFVHFVNEYHLARDINFLNKEGVLTQQDVERLTVWQINL